MATVGGSLSRAPCCLQSTCAQFACSLYCVPAPEPRCRNADKSRNRSL